MTSNNDFGSSECHKPNRMYCHEYKEYTQSIKLIFIRRYHKQTFSILAKCEKCNEIKNIALFDDFYKKFNPYYFDLKLSKFFLNEITDNNGIKHKIEKDLFYLINEPLEERDRF